MLPHRARRTGPWSFRRRHAAGFLMAAALAYAAAPAADALPQLDITAIALDNTYEILEIHGENFDNGYWPPEVTLDGFPLTVDADASDAVRLVTDFSPFSGVASAYLLEVTSGDQPENYDVMCMGVDDLGQPYICTLPEPNTVTSERESFWRVAQAPPPGQVGEESVIIRWKDGPTKISDTHNKWGDPIFYQLQTDYIVDLRQFFIDYPDELDRCDDTYDNDRTRLLNRLDALDDVHWSRNPDIPSDGYGYMSLDDGILVVKRGYRWDGPSLQAGSRRIAPKPRCLQRATIVHDALYDFMRMQEIDRGGDNRHLADCLLYMFSRRDNMEKSKAKSNYTVVRAGGWIRDDDPMPAWKFHAVAHAGEDQELDCAPPDGLDVRLNGSGSEFADLWFWQWEENGVPVTVDGSGPDPSVTQKFAPGTHSVRLTVDDGNDGEDGGYYRDYDDVVIQVNADVRAPEFLLAKDIHVSNDPGQCSAVVPFDVVASDDCKVKALTCAPAADSTFPVGATMVACEATDTGGNASATQFVVTVTDDEPPSLAGPSRPMGLWPPDHRYAIFRVAEHVHSVTDNCTEILPDQVRIFRVTSDEPEDSVSRGDGSTRNDIVIWPDGRTVSLRRETARPGNGRVYTVWAEVFDASMNRTVESFQVHVVDVRRGLALDDGPVYVVDRPAGPSNRLGGRFAPAGLREPDGRFPPARTP